MQKVALCITELEPGGAERCLVRLATGLDRARFTPKVYVLAPPPENRALLDTLEAADVPVQCFDLRHFWQFPLGIRRLRRALRRDKIDVVQSFLFHANITARLAAKEISGVKVYSGIRVAEHRSRWPLTLDWITEGYVTAHVAVSESVARFSLKEAKLSEEKMVIIPNGIDLSLYDSQPVSSVTCDRNPNRPQAVGLTTNGLTKMLYVGRLDPQKNVEMLLGAMPRLFEMLTQHGIEAELLLAGEGPQRKRLESLRAELGLEEWVHLLGYRDDVRQLLQEASLLVLPSRWEGMSNVLLEAMAAARPIVASRVEGVAELLGETLDDQSFPRDDPDAMRARIVAILTNPDLAAHLSHANRARIAQHFTLEKMLDRYMGLWES
ncbi:MAG: glycosyltransferase [Planctomycetia bacterium]|jgi:glycosyltransferase involved in cell wall biosynthesis